ncbi:MAG: hypothetical protein COA63_010720 [Methylophaga sp.]|nr:hypothetical protein [Methylophaga sp.]
MHILKAIISWLILFLLVKLPLYVLGIFVVPIALRWRITSPVRDPLKQSYPTRMIVNLPKWAWIWGNASEGAMSWMKKWPEICWDKNPKSLLSMWQWLAIRNPSNNLKFTRGLAVNLHEVREYTLLAGTSDRVSAKYNLKGHQFFAVKGKYFRYYNFLYVGDIFWVRLGHKIEPRHFPVDIHQPIRKLWKGMTFRIGLMSRYQ